MLVASPALARQWTNALRHARACAPPLGLASADSSSAKHSGDDIDDDDETNSDGELKIDPDNMAATCEGWLLKARQWRFCRVRSDLLFDFKKSPFFVFSVCSLTAIDCCGVHHREASKLAALR